MQSRKGIISLSQSGREQGPLSSLPWSPLRATWCQLLKISPSFLVYLVLLVCSEMVPHWSRSPMQATLTSVRQPTPPSKVHSRSPERPMPTLLGLSFLFKRCARMLTPALLEKTKCTLNLQEDVLTVMFNPPNNPALTPPFYRWTNGDQGE